MKQCDWRGPICTVDKAPDHLIAWEVTNEAGDIALVSPEAITTDFTGYSPSALRIYGEPLPVGTQITPVLDKGTEVVVRRGCMKRPNHRGSHGRYRWQGWLGRLRDR